MKKKLKAIWGKAAELKDKAVELKDNKQLNQLWDKAAENEHFNKMVDQFTNPTTNKQIAQNAALSVALGVVTGGAILPVIALAAAEGVVTKAWMGSAAAKKFATANRNRKSNKPKDGPAPQ